MSDFLSQIEYEKQRAKMHKKAAKKRAAKTMTREELDVMVERNAGNPLKEILSPSGARYFRRAVVEAADLIANNDDDGVGSLILFSTAGEEPAGNAFFIIDEYFKFLDNDEFGDDERDAEVLGLLMFAEVELGGCDIQ